MARFMQHCRHYDVDIKTLEYRCGAGCDMTGPKLKCLPLPEPGRPSPEFEPCPKREEYTAQERQEAIEKRKQRQAEAAELLKRLEVSVRAASGDKGTFDCPRCKSTVHWWKAPENGHLRAACETKNCMGLIQ